MGIAVIILVIWCAYYFGKETGAEREAKERIERFKYRTGWREGMNEQEHREWMRRTLDDKKTD